jgi:hypothetical protein
MANKIAGLSGNYCRQVIWRIPLIKAWIFGMMHNPLATKELYTFMEDTMRLWHAMCYALIHIFYTKEKPQTFFDFVKRIESLCEEF